MGFVRLFGVVGSFLVKPQFLKNLDEEFFAYRLEEDCIRRRSGIGFYSHHLQIHEHIYNHFIKTLLYTQTATRESNRKIIRFASAYVNTNLWFSARR